MSIILLSVELWGRIDPACIIIDLEQLKDWGGVCLQNCRKREGAEGDFPLRVLCGLSAETHGKTRLILDVALHIYLYTLI